MVRSTTFAILALSIASVFATSSAPSSHQLARRHHTARSKSLNATRSTPKKRKTCSASSSSGSGSTTPATSGSSSGSTSSSGSDSGSGSTTAPPPVKGGGPKNSTTTPDTGDDSGDDSGSDSGSTGSAGSTSHVLPSGKAVAGWTLVTELPSDVSNVHTYSFDEDTFIYKSDMKTLPHPVKNGVMTISFEKGAYDLKSSPVGGFSFYTPGPSKAGSSSTPIVDLAALNARTVSFGYSALFSKGFQCNKGGKMPGLMGGTSWDTAITASGGNHPTNAWSTRMMFRPECAGELYVYVPANDNRANLCGPKGITKCVGPDAGNGKTYGASIGTGNFHWATNGSWTSIRQVVHLNSPGQKDGWVKVYVNGASTPAIEVDDISFGPDGTKHWGQQMQSFFGGHAPIWASPQAQNIQFKDFSVVVLDTM